MGSTECLRGVDTPAHGQAGHLKVGGHTTGTGGAEILFKAACWDLFWSPTTTKLAFLAKIKPELACD